MLRNFLTVCLLILCVSANAQTPALAKKKEPAVKTLPELKTALDTALKKYRIPGMSVVLIDSSGVVWARGLGVVNKEKGITATENSVFRLGSISKMMVSLAILKLIEEGKLQLDEKVRDIIPEIEFTNRWEDTHPVRIVHLLEHTTGWDDIHLVEYAHDVFPETLKQALDFHPHSRICRWMPGSRMSYCNAGPPVAAYIVEKKTGMRYEDYIQKNFFDPLGMKTATFFNDSIYQRLGTTVYRDSGKPFEYENIIFRPSGSLNASALDMAKLISFYLARGKSDSSTLLSNKSIDRMEQAKSNPGIDNGLEFGYGLGNYTSVAGKLIYHGHSGAVTGARAELGYLPKEKVGYFFAINSENGMGYEKISKIIRDYQASSLADSVFTEPEKYNGTVEIEPGYYELINPRIQSVYFLSKLNSIYQFKKNEKGIEVTSWLNPKVTQHYPVSPTQYLSGKTGKIGMVQAEDPLNGKVIYYSSAVLAPISSFFVFGRIVIAVVWILMMIAGVFIWVISLFQNKIKHGYTRKLFLFPVLASFSIFAAMFLASYGGADPFIRMGNITAVSVGILVSTLFFAVTAFASVVFIYRLRNISKHNAIFITAAILTSLHIVITVYLMIHGAIPFVVWA